MASRRGTRSDSSSIEQLKGDILARVIGTIRKLANVAKVQVTRGEQPRERPAREGSDIYD